jgi:protein-S-isoprenylcysteine O-methyltransferase Ste14
MTKGHKRQSHEHRNDLAGEHKWSDSGQGVFLIIFIIGMTSDLLLLKMSDSWQNAFPWYFRIVFFIPLLFFAIYFLNRAHTIVFKKERKELMLINTDVFARIRHPMYFGALLMYLAFVVLSFSVIALVIFILVVIFYYYICRYEEKILIEKLGNEYKKYMKKVPMLIPRLGK